MPPLLYVEGYCSDAKKKYLRYEEYTQITKRLTARTGWTIRELEGWLAYQESKACDGSRVLGTKRAQMEAMQVAKGGPRGERTRAVRAIREVLGERVWGAAEPVVTFAMVRGMRDNKRGICGGSREGATAAIPMAAAQEGMKVEMFEAYSNKTINKNKVRSEGIAMALVIGPRYFVPYVFVTYLFRLRLSHLVA